MAQEAARCGVISFQVPVATVDFFSEAIASDALAVSIHGEEEDATHRIQAIVEGTPDEAAWQQRLKILAACVGISDIAANFEQLPDKNWLLEVQNSFKPIHAGRFFVYGSHYKGEYPTGIIKILIDAGMAFGSGEHASTRGCLEAIDRLAAGGFSGTMLDVGTGSGILAIAMAKSAPDSRITASDIDPISVKVAAENMITNNVPHVVVVESDGFTNGILAENAPYNLVTANILARPLIELAPAIYGVTANGGKVILAGLLTSQADAVTAAYVGAGFAEHDEIKIGEWSTLIMEKRA